MKDYKFNKEWLNKLLEVKDNDSVWLSLSDNDTRILLTYIEVLQFKIDKAIEYNKEVLTWTTNEPITDEIAYKNLEILRDKGEDK